MTAISFNKGKVHVKARFIERKPTWKKKLKTVSFIEDNSGQ
uniref:Uncharacterized protein n=1 Tax=Nannochloropsis gaditana (strain CCMP526) TaxID=1093141 RepID=I2CRT3_NANGC